MPRFPIIYQKILLTRIEVEIDSIILRHPVAVVTAAVAEEPFINPEDVEVLFTAAPPHVTIELCRCEDGSNVERPIEIIVDGNVADTEIVVFGFTMSFERLICASKPVNDVNGVLK
ncbi:hypothetical protein V6N13_079328 [Hibiscus sabdariffa]|uniref:Uncharacterized protein n=1 Tax=Hibiscus sabdariffa TaxID=183260 RepID=A0ABR2RR67_9ROSI